MSLFVGAFIGIRLHNTVFAMDKLGSTSIKNVVLAKSEVPGHSGHQLELVDVNGRYTNEPTAGPFQGPNWIGQFQLRLVNLAGRTLFRFKLPNTKYATMLFLSKFQFHFADYNGDGCPDFTLGQYADSNGYTYQLYTVEPNGISQLMTKPTAQLFVSDFTYSPLFKKVKSNGFEIKYYDNSQGKWFESIYKWEGSRFVQIASKSASR